MMIDLVCDGKFQRIDLPHSVLEIQDVLDRYPVWQNGSLVTFRFCDKEFESRMPGSLFTKPITDDLYLLNEFVRRYEDLTEVQKLAFAVLVNQRQPKYLENAFPLTSGLDSVITFKASNYEDLGKICIAEEQLPAVAECPMRVRPYLDAEKLGRELAEMLDGAFLEGYYFGPQDYVCPDLKPHYPKPDGALFRLLIGNDEFEKEEAIWIALPSQYEDLYSLEVNFVMDLEHMQCYRFESALPALQRFDLHDRDELFALNDLAWKLSKLDADTFLKYKAVMDAAGVTRISDAKDLLEQLYEYTFEPVADCNEYGQRFLAKLLPESLSSALDETDLYDLGQTMLQKIGGKMTDYGVVMKGNDLYPVTQQTDEPEEEMGGMRL